MQARRKLIVVSNRGPIGYVREGGERIARRGAGGLVTALAPLVSHHDVTWIASALSDEDRVVAAEGPVEATAADGSRYRLRLVAHDPVAYDLYYHVVANPALWFVQHGLWELKHEPEHDLRPRLGRGLRRRQRGHSPTQSSRSWIATRARPSSSTTTTCTWRRGSCGSGCRTRVIAHFTHIPWVEPGRLVGAAGRDRQGDPREPARCDVVSFHTDRWREAFRVGVRRDWASTPATRS